MSNERENKIVLTASSIASLKAEQRVGSIDPNRVGKILSALLNLIAGDTPITPGGQELPDYDPDDITELVNKVTVDRDNNLLRVKDQQDVFVCPVELLEKPVAPTYSGDTAIVSTNNTETITLSTSTNGAVIVYTMTSDGSEPTDPREATSPTEGTTIELTGILGSQTKTFTIKAASKKNGEFSNSILNLTITTTRKIATPTITESAKQFDTSRPVTLACGTSGAKIYYTTDGTTPSATNGTLYTAPFDVTANSDNPAQTTVKAIAILENWTSSDSASKTITAGSVKTYIGFSTKTALESANDVQGLQLVIKATTPDKNNLYTVTQNTSGAVGYIWICCPGTINPSKVYSSADAVIDMGFNSAISVGSWNCYRIGEAINETRTTLLVKS